MGEQLHTQKNSNNNIFERVIKPILKYIGLIGATIMSILYVVIVVILITGFKTHELKDDVIFALVNAGVGLIIMQFLKIQGTSFAKDLPENQEILKEYYNSKTKDKKLHSIKFYWTTSIIWDIIIKGITVVITTIGIIYLVIQGMHDYTLLLLAIVNLIMFICFGMLGLSNAFDFYNNRHIPYIKEQIKNKEKQNEYKLQRNKQTSTRSTNSGGIQ